VQSVLSQRYLHLLENRTRWQAGFGRVRPRLAPCDVRAGHRRSSNALEGAFGGRASGRLGVSWPLDDGVVCYECRTIALRVTLRTVSFWFSSTPYPARLRAWSTIYMAQTTHPDVFIVESLDFDDEDTRKEGEIIYRTLKMSGKNPIYHYVRTKKELSYFIDEFSKSRYRYFHLSCHGNVDLFATTFDNMSGDDLARLFGHALDGKRLFLSTCLAAELSFARKVFTCSTCNSVAGPVGTIAFDDSAVLWTAFYHLMFKTDSEAMKREALLLNLSKAGLLLDQQVRAFTRVGTGRAKEYTLPPASKQLSASDVDTEDS
jgi:hypothetical protein